MPNGYVDAIRSRASALERRGGGKMGDKQAQAKEAAAEAALATAAAMEGGEDEEGIEPSVLAARKEAALEKRRCY
jgi:hypothetical protein